jgi:hypothetical protein
MLARLNEGEDDENAGEELALPLGKRGTTQQVASLPLPMHSLTSIKRGVPRNRLPSCQLFASSPPFRTGKGAGIETWGTEALATGTQPLVGVWREYQPRPIGYGNRAGVKACFHLRMT